MRTFVYHWRAKTLALGLQKKQGYRNPASHPSASGLTAVLQRTQRAGTQRGVNRSPITTALPPQKKPTATNHSPLIPQLLSPFVEHSQDRGFIPPPSGENGTGPTRRRNLISRLRSLPFFNKGLVFLGLCLFGGASAWGSEDAETCIAAQAQALAPIVQHVQELQQQAHLFSSWEPVSLSSQKAATVTDILGGLVIHLDALQGASTQLAQTLPSLSETGCQMPTLSTPLHNLESAFSQVSTNLAEVCNTLGLPTETATDAPVPDNESDRLFQQLQFLQGAISPSENNLTVVAERISQLPSWRYFPSLVEKISKIEPALQGIRKTLSPCFQSTSLCPHPSAANTDSPEAGAPISLAAVESTPPDPIPETQALDEPLTLASVLETYQHSCLDQALDGYLQTCTPLVNILRQLALTTQWPDLLTAALDSAFDNSQRTFEALWRSCEALHDSLRADTDSLSDASMESLSSVQEVLSQFISSIQDGVNHSTLQLQPLDTPFTLTPLTSYANATEIVASRFLSLLTALNNALDGLHIQLSQQAIIFPYKEKLISLVDTFAQKDVGAVLQALLQTTRQNLGYPLGAQPLIETLDTTQRRLGDLKTELESPTCFLGLETMCQPVTEQALMLTNICQTLSQSTESLGRLITPPLSWPLVQLFEAHASFMANASRLLGVPITSFETLDLLSQKVTEFGAQFWQPFVDWWQPFCTALTSLEGRSSRTLLSFSEQLAIWQEALNATVPVFKALQVSSQATPAWSLIETLQTAARYLDETSTKLRLLSQVFSAELWTSCQQPDALAGTCLTWADTSLTLSATLTDLTSVLDSTCCAKINTSAGSLLEAFSYAACCLEKALPQNNSYATYLTSVDDPHEFLDTLANTLLPSFNQHLGQLAAEIETSSTDKTAIFCHSSKLADTMDALTLTAQKFAEQCQDFCRHLNVVPPERQSLLPLDSVNLTSFWRPLLEAVVSFQRSAICLSDIHKANAYTVNTARLLTLFHNLRQEFTSLATTFTRISAGEPRSLCENCSPWPNVPLSAVQALMQQITTTLPTPMSSECCQAYSDELSFLQEQLQRFLPLQDLWLSSVEKTFLQHLETHHSLGGETSLPFLSVMLPLTQQLPDLESAVEGFVRCVQELSGTSSNLCQTSSCISPLHQVGLVLTHMNRIFQAHLPKEMVNMVSSVDLEIQSESPCEERVIRATALYQGARSAFDRWSVFSNRWQELDCLSHSQDLMNVLCQAASFSQNFQKLLQQLCALYADTERQSSFCPHCSSEGALKVFLASLLETNPQPFQDIAIKSTGLCPVEIDHAKADICRLFQQITGLLTRLQQDSLGLQTLVNNHLSDFGASLKPALQGLFDCLSLKLCPPETTSCLAERLRPLYKGIITQLIGLASALQDWVRQEAPLLAESHSATPGQDSLDESNTLSLLTPLTAAWQGLCSQINALTPDHYRQTGSFVLQEIAEELNALIPHLEIFEELKGQAFCNGHLLEVPDVDSLQSFVSDLVAVTRTTTQDLHGDNCCDAHARCIYSITQMLRPCLRALFQLSFSDCIRCLTPYFSKMADILSLAQRKLSQVTTAENATCLLSSIEGEFANLEKATLTFTENVRQENPFPEPQFVDWDHYSAHTKNDCSCLQDLYEDLRALCDEGLQELITTAAHAPAAILAQGAYGCSMLASSLNNLLTLSSTSGPLCNTCPTYTPNHVLHHLAEALSSTTSFFQQMASLPTTQTSQHVLQDTVSLLRQAVGDRQVSTSQPIQGTFSPEALDQFSQQMLNFTRGLQQIAKFGEKR